MKLNKLLVSLALVATGSVMVACGSGSSGGNSNPVPNVVPLPLPYGFVVPTGSATGIAFNATSGQIAIPGKGGYQANIIQLTPEQVKLVADSIESGQVLSQQANGSVLIAPAATPSNPAPAGTIVSALTPIKANAQSKSVQTTNVTSCSVTMQKPFSALNMGVIVLPNDTSQSVVFFAAYPNDMAANSETYGKVATITCDGTIPLQIPNTCTGNINTIATGTNNGSAYVSWGTDTQNNNVCVYQLNTDSVENLAAKAPTPNDPDNNGYLGGAVNYLGFSSTQGNNIVGYWNANNQIYKIFGSVNNTNVTPTGFLNITKNDVAQRPIGGAQSVTFTNAPASNNINSTYTDANSTVWVGTKDGQVYSLYKNQTAWNSQNPTVNGVPLTGNVTVEPAANSNGVGTIATGFIGGVKSAIGLGF